MFLEMHEIRRLFGMLVMAGPTQSWLKSLAYSAPKYHNKYPSLTIRNFANRCTSISSRNADTWCTCLHTRADYIHTRGGDLHTGLSRIIYELCKGRRLGLYPETEALQLSDPVILFKSILRPFRQFLVRSKS